MYKVKEEGAFRYIDTEGDKGTLLLLHGLFGALSNFEGILNRFGKEYRVIVPMLPIFELPLRKLSIKSLVLHVHEFVEFLNLQDVHVLGNSLGGHIALIYTLEYPQRVASLTLTGSSGLFENAMGSSFPQRSNYEFISSKVAQTFYDPNFASKDLVDEVYGIVNDKTKGLRIVVTAKSAVRHNLKDKLHEIKIPTLLVWGKQDIITPEFVGEKFHELMEHSQLYIVDKCGHAPMMERPALFNSILESFLTSLELEQFERKMVYKE